ncbi:9-O-acetylesterase [Sphingomonas ginkgonis]|uniref:9-O-acetylesterase n=1 Tax=Sphingomonas ginkgonis TaxID=2315330 RepID=A0A429V8G1_9SPHN|nr:sialate O-acetylesterase [Sphingomonas ginkgonis]RST30214.1 9-O-acetylesterase [Sphingomonas ginkgonis]
MLARPALILAALLASTSALAAPAIDPMLGDHAVIQRGKPILLRGTATAGERLQVAFAGVTRSVAAGRDGRWRLALPAMPAGGPYTLTATGRGGASATSSDLLVGDVWLCSGQSNMELPVSRALNLDTELANADDPQLRLLHVAKKTSLDPASAFADVPQWRAANRDSVPSFSAACYFMGRDLRKSEKVPMGLIDATWGGTAIRSWLDPEGARRASREDAQLLDLYRRDPAAANRQFGTTWERWWNARQPSQPWAQPDTLAWKPMKVGYWEKWGDPFFANFDGIVWARSDVEVTAAQASQAATLSLGVIDEIDQSWVNGVPVGNSFGWDYERSYRLPAGTLHAGRNTVVVNLLDSSGYGGFAGPETKLGLHFADGSTVPLAPSLRYSVAPSDVGTPPRPPWDTAAGLSLIYDGMIAPMGAEPLRGIAWYQGETDAGMAEGYGDRLTALASGWRRQFGDPALPFLVVGLPGWGPPPVAPVASGWAMVRDAQRRFGTGDPHAALVPAIDIGDRLELHPPQKQEVGHRLARAARTLAYGATAPASGPQAGAAQRSGNDVVVSFTGVSGALHGWSGPPVGFELCGDSQASCRFAAARVEGATVRVLGDGQPATRVRFAWADAPVVNLHDDSTLPVSSFELPVR